MIILAAALTLGINLEIDLGSLVNRQKPQSASVAAGTATCNIKVVGYHFRGRPGQQFRYARQTFTIPAEGFVEVIALPKLTTYTAEGQTLPLENGDPMDAFSLRWITLPETTGIGGMK